MQEPLAADADPQQFAEGRVLQHLRVLAEDIGYRHVSLSRVWGAKGLVFWSRLWLVGQLTEAWQR